MARALFKLLSHDKETKNPRFIVSLTSFPARIKFLQFTILSILKQTKKPDFIAVFLSLEEFPDKKLPLILRILESLDLTRFYFRAKNFRAYTKLIYALEAFPDDNIITIDDDQFYDKTMLESLFLEHKAHKNAIVAHAFYDRFKELLNLDSNKRFDIIEGKLNMFGIPLGVGGVLYPPDSLHSDVFKSEIFTQVSPLADDLWFWAMGVLNKTPKILVKNALSHSKNWTIAEFESPHLYHINSLQNKNISQMRAILKKYPEILEILDLRVNLV